MSTEISGILPAGPAMAGPGQTGRTDSAQSPAETFKQMLDQTVENLNEADRSILEANTGGAADLHDVMIAMEKADVSLQMLVQVRNKAVDAYDQIMNMQV
ncbi:MAG: flagellar hook-basal body complex protein FliE [Desulfobacterales bacterium]